MADYGAGGESDEPKGYTRRNLKDYAQRAHLNVDPVVAEALDRFELSAETMDAQRRAILEAKRFRGGNQWPEQIRNQRQGAPAIQGQAAQPPRPCLTIDRVSAPVRQVSNVIRQSQFSIEALPSGEGADQETAKIFNGWIRRIQNESRGDQPVEWAADSAAEGGLGWFYLSAYYTEDDDRYPFDQDVRICRVPNSLSVYPDPFANKPTRSDMRFLIVTEDISREEFKRCWPNAKIAELDQFSAIGDSNGWVTSESIRIAEYWRCEYEDVRIVELNDGTALVGDRIPSGLKKGDGPRDIKRERKRYDPHIKWSKITAVEELEATDWLGTRIPYIPILGEELNIDGQVKLRGVIEPAMDSQRMLNYTFSAAVESAALAPKAPFIYAAGQVERHKNIWQQAATTNFFGLPYDPVDLNGQPVPPPQRNVAEQPIQAFVQLMGASEEAIKATTTVFDPSLGNSNPRERSGTAIEALQRQSEFGNSNYQDNVARAMVYCGELLVELGPKILDRPGRILQILQLDGTATQTMLGQPFTPHPQTGAPQPVMNQGQPVMDPEQAKLQAGEAKFYDLKAGKYSVTITVGRDHATRRREESDALGQLIPHLPPEMQATLTPEYIRTLDFSDAERIADIATRSLPPQLQQAISGQMPQLPPQVQQQLAQIPMLNAALQQAKQIIDTKSVEQQGHLDRVKFEGTRDLLLAHVNNAAKILVAHITAAKEAGTTQIEAELQARATGIEQAFDAYKTSIDNAHQFALQQLKHTHERTLSAQEHQQELAQIAAQPEPPIDSASAGA